MSRDLRNHLAGWRQRAGRWSSTLTDLVLPPVCGNCGQVGELMCDRCVSQVVWLEDPICHQCGRPSEKPTTWCLACRRDPIPLNQIRTATLYSGPLPGVLRKMKYEGFFALAEPLAKLMLAAWPRWRRPVDLVLPIPLYPDRERERGYNQAELLVHVLQSKLGWESDANTLRRIRHTRPQVGLSAKQRRDNVKGAFSAAPDKVTGKQILLVDDVRTSGSTLVAAAMALLASGATSVSAYCLTSAIDAHDTLDV